jgi:hypothetical protein
MPREKMAMRFGTLSKFTQAGAETASHMADFHPSACGLNGQPLAHSPVKSSFNRKI